MRRALTIVLVFCLYSAGAQLPTVKWYYDINDASFGQTATADMDGEGRLELAFSTYWNDSFVHVLNAETGTLKWKRKQPGPLGGCNDAGPLIFDADNNGDLEVIVPGSCMDTTFCMDADSGFVQWKTVTGGGDSPPTAADLNNDGVVDVLHGTFDGRVVCLNGTTGAIQWSVMVDANAAIESEPAILDADDNGVLDFVVATWNLGNLDSNKIACYRGDNHTLLWQQLAPKEVMYHGPAFGDIDRDGKYELTIGDYDGYWYILSAETGAIARKDSFGSTFNYIGAPTTLADIDNDDTLDVILCDAYNIHVRRHNGTIIWSHPLSSTAFRGVSVADVNNDNYLDISYGTSDGLVQSLSGLDGSVIVSMDLAAAYGDTFEIDHAPIIADFDNDGIKDLFIVGGKARYPVTNQNYGRAYCLSWGTGKGPDWTMFRRDVRRSACVCDSLGLPLSPLSASILSSTALPSLKIFPNPATAELNIESIKAIGDLRIVNLLGQTVYSGKLAAKVAKINIAHLPPGMYYLQTTEAASKQFMKH